jgi:putative ABC transport system substrate-binding protein
VSASHEPRGPYDGRRPSSAIDAWIVRLAEQAEGLIVLVSPMFNVQRKQIIDRAATKQIPTIYEWKEFVQSGGLISYGADNFDIYRRAAGYVDEILKGAKPADLRIEQPTKFELVVNLKTAKALGLRSIDSRTA